MPLVAAVDRFEVLFAGLLAAVDRLLVVFAGAAFFAVDLVEVPLLAADLRDALAGAALLAVPRLAGAVLALALRVVEALRVPAALLVDALRAPVPLLDALRAPVALLDALRAPVVLRPPVLLPALALRGAAFVAPDAAPPVDAVPSETVAVAAAFRSESMALRQDALRL